MQWWLPFLLVGLSLLFWLLIGGVRLTAQGWARLRGGRGDGADAPALDASDVAVVIPAHDEETVIAATIVSALQVVTAAQIHVVADGCTDRTAEIARGYGVHVLEIAPARGKAGGIEAAIARFAIPDRFEVLLIIDADTRLGDQYVSRGLRLLADDDMVAVAGYAHVDWRPAELTTVGRFLLSYRARLYAVMQWMKYGQTWRHTNVTTIVPGFASMYRTRVLPRMDLNPPGLVIEDFNMTFELHHKRLGKVAFTPSVFAICQDPANLGDYLRQINRWWLGFWQTVRRHGLWFSGFSAALGVFLLEVLAASVVILLIVLALAFLALEPLSGGAALGWGWYTGLHAELSPIMTPLNLLLFLFVPDYLMTCVVAVWLRRPSMLLYGLGFLVLRLIDAAVTLRTIGRVWRTRSDGRWVSPARRAVATPAATAPTGLPATAVPDPGAAVPAPRRRRPVVRCGWAGALAILQDALLVVAVVLVAGALVAAGTVPLAVALLVVVVAAVVAVRVSSRQAASR